MSGETNNTTADLLKSSVGRIISNIGVILAHTKDALLKDLLQDMPSYLPEITKADNYTYEAFKQACQQSGKMPLEKFIEALFNRLGYQLSAFEQNKEMADNIRSIFATTLSLSESIRQLFEEQTDWMGEAKSFMDQMGSASGGAIPVNDLFNDPALLNFGSGSNSVSISLGDNKIVALFKVVLDLISLIRKFRDINWGAIKQEYADFGSYFGNAYLNEKFAERLFDHILTVLLRNAKDVFADDINAIVDHIEEVRNSATNEVKTEINKVITQVKALRNEILAIESEIKTQAQQLITEATAAGKEVAGEVSVELQTRLKVAKAKLHQLVAKFLGDYNRIGKIFTQIYAILDFLKVIDKVTIQVPGMSGVNIAEIYVIRWSKLEQLFSNPLNYFKTLYTLKDYDDAEALLSKILELARAFSSDVPDFGSIKRLLYEFLIRIRDRIKDETNALSAEVKRKFAQFESFIIDLLKVLEKFAVEVKTKLGAAYGQFETGGTSLIGELQSGITDAITPLKVSGKLKDFTLPNTNIQFKKLSGVNTAEIKDYLNTLFTDPFITTIAEQAGEHTLFGNINADEWKTAIQSSITSNFTISLLGKYKTVLDTAETQVTGLFDNNTWETQFRTIILALKNDFARQTAKVPNDFEGVKNFCKGSIENLITGEKLNYPFSDFDFMEYFSSFSDKLKALAPNKPEDYFIQFKDITVSVIKDLMKTNSVLKSKIPAGTSDEKLTAFAQQVFYAYWPKLKAAFFKAIVRPFAALVEQSVKKWVKEKLIPALLEAVKSNIANELNLGAYQELFDNVNTAVNQAKQLGGEIAQGAQTAWAWAENAIDMVKDILMLYQDAKAINSWGDGIQFALKLYKLTPAVVKQYLRELINLPDWNFESLVLPEYKLDTKNKFLAVTLYEYPGKDNIHSNNYTAEISIQLLAFVGDRSVVRNGVTAVESGLYVLPRIRGSFGTDINIGESHHLLLNANAALNSAVNDPTANSPAISNALASDVLGFFFTTPAGAFIPNVEVLDNAGALSAYLELLFKRGQKGQTTVPPLTVFETDVAGLTIGNYPQKLFVGYSNGFDCGYLGRMEDLNFRLSLRKLNGFFEIILSNDIEIRIEHLELGYSLQQGLKLDGQYKLRIPINANLKLPSIQFGNMSIELGSGDLKNIGAQLLTNFTVDFKGLAFAFSELGFGIDFNYMKPGGGFGDWDLSPKFQFPTGIGISINMEAVRGTGFLQWNKQKEEFLGALELNIINMCSASALVMFNMKMPDGSKGFSFMGALCVYFTPGIQLSMGFSITGLGGSLGINRMIDIDKLRGAVRDGSLESVLFVKDLNKNLNTVLANMSSYYPIRKDQFFFGFLARITWVKILDIDLGLFIQAPSPVVIMIAGGLHLKVADKLLVINVYFAGGIDFSKGLFFDASLVDSQIVGISLSGDMALRIYWAGATRGFLLSAGGFHPQYTPDPGFNVGGMRRMAMKLDYKIVKISLETYFAVTSNTLQFGAKFQLKIGWSKFGITGEMYFDALFQFSPFRFMVDIGAKVGVKCGSWTLMSIGLDFALSGPAQWHAKGKASFRFLFIKIKVGFEYSWGKKPVEANKQLISLLPQFMDNYYDIDNLNWKITSGDIVDGLVELVKFNKTDLVMQPSDRLSFSQDFLPLEEKMVRYGEATPSDVTKIELQSLNINGEELAGSEWEQTDSYFAPTLIRELENSEKLKAPSFEKMKAGFVLTASYSENNGGSKPSDQDKIETGFDAVNWGQWQNYADNNPLPLTPYNILLAPPSILSVTAALNQLNVKLTKIPNTRPSMRRTERGFQRHVLAMELKLHQNVDNLIELLDNN